MQNSEFWIRISSLFGFQTSPVDLCMQNSAINTRIACLHVSQTSAVVLCMLPSHVISVRITSLYGSQPSFVAFACNTATSGPESQVSMGPRPHLWFLAFKTETLAPECASLYESQPSSVVLCIHNSAIMTRINSLYGSQT